MRQDPKAQIPGIDLTFADGPKGWVWGTSGVDDIRGASFDKARASLRQRAVYEGTFKWTIVIDLDQIMSSAFKSLLGMMSALDKLVTEKPDRRSVTVEWLVGRGDDSMRTVAEDVWTHIQKGQKKRRRKGIEIKISDRKTARAAGPKASR